MSYTYDETTQIYTVPFSEFDALLQSLPENTVDTYYKINVTELTLSNCQGASSMPTTKTTLQGVIGNNTKYVYLAVDSDSYAETITTMQYCFCSCTFFCGIDYIPDSVTSMNACFKKCTSFNQPVTIPNSVTDMNECFSGCSSFNQPIIIPNSVTNMSYCFYVCTSFNQPITIGNSVTDMSYCFSGCSALKEIIMARGYADAPTLANAFNGCTNLKAIYTNTTKESDKWHYVRIDNSDDTNVSYQIYEEGSEFDSDGNLSPKYSGTFERTGNNYELPIATDELIFDTNAPLTDETVKQHLKYKLPFYKNALDPSKENFVLWGANSETFRTNLNISSTFPIGFVYTQYSGTPNPNTLALSVPTGCHWEDITTNYNGEFFRAYKSGTSSEFSESEIIEQAYQTELPSHNHNASGSSASAGSHNHAIWLGSGAVKDAYWGAVGRANAVINSNTLGSSGSHTHTISVSTNATSISQETRPINSSIKIWQVQKDTTE